MLRPGHIVALCVLTLLTLGVVMVNSASMGVRIVGAETTTPPVTAESIMFSRSTAYMGLAMLAMGVGAFVPVRRIAARLNATGAHNEALDANGGRAAFAGLPLLALAAIALIAFCATVYLPVIGSPRNGSHRWIGLTGDKEGLTMQPSEIAKWCLVVVMAWYGTTRACRIQKFWTGLIPALACVAGVAGFIVLEDLGTGALIAMAAAVVLLAAGARIWHFLVFVPPAALGLVAAIVTSDYRMRRILAFMNPYEDPEGRGYHMIQSLRAVAEGKVFGRGLGFGIQKLGYLPEDRTDFIFAIICEELGIAGAALVVGLFAGLIWAGLAILRREHDRFLRLFILGIITTVGLQAIINLAVVTGLAPTKGIALPMLSSGGTGWILTAFSLGLVIAVDRTRGREARSADLYAGGSEIESKAGADEAPSLVAAVSGGNAMVA